MDGPKIFIITIDGPVASGKGSVARELAKILGYHYLESGVIYRIIAVLILQYFIDRKIGLDRVRAIATKIKRSSPEQILPVVNQENLGQIIELISVADLEINDNEVIVNGKELGELVFNETVGLVASFYSRISEIRSSVINLQRSFAKSPGLVTDGRDMGSVIFAEADLKVFLTATVKVRAERAYHRYCKLHNQVEDNKFEEILHQLKLRDEQDTNRKYAQLQYDDSYLFIDSSSLSITQVVDKILDLLKLKINK